MLNVRAVAEAQSVEALVQPYRGRFFSFLLLLLFIFFFWKIFFFLFFLLLLPQFIVFHLFLIVYIYIYSACV